MMWESPRKKQKSSVVCETKEEILECIRGDIPFEIASNVHELSFDGVNPTSLLNLF
jgi:hypothetical protein